LCKLHWETKFSPTILVLFTFLHFSLLL
jgi:hypothetical protein